LHLLGTLKKLVVTVCVVLTCIAGAVAHTERKEVHHSGTVHKTHAAKKGKGAGASTVHSRSTAAKSQRKNAHASAANTKTAPTPARFRGQQAIDGNRAREIQEALIREKYLDGEPNGVWDQHTKDAMIRFQSENGWQSKVVPDSRALIKLGLGPKHANLINPEPISLPDSARDMRPGGSATMR
jgi:hypothetical protein